MRNILSKINKPHVGLNRELNKAQITFNKKTSESEYSKEEGSATEIVHVLNVDRLKGLIKDNISSNVIEIVAMFNKVKTTFVITDYNINIAGITQISRSSPIGNALSSMRIGEIKVVSTPGGNSILKKLTHMIKS